MLLKKSTPIMKCGLVLFALLDLAYLVYANQGEPGPSAEEPGSPTSSLLQLSVMPSLFPDVSATSRMIANHPKSTETKLTTVSPFSGTSSSTHAQTSDVMKSEAHTTSLVQKRSLAASATPNLMQSQAGTASLVQSSISTDGHTEIPSAAQSPAKQSDVATGIVHSSISTTSDTRYSSVMQSPDMKETQAGSTNIMHASTAGGTRSAIQTHHLVQSKALTTDHAFASVPESAKSLNVPPTGTVVTIVSHLISKLTRDIMQSQAHSTTVAHASIFESVATRLPSSLAVPPPSTVLAQQNTSHRSISTQLHVPLSTQVPVITSEMKNNSSTMLFSASQSLDVVAMTTKGAPSSITPVKSLPSTSDVVARVTSSLGITPSGLASYGPSQLLTAVHTSWLQSSSVMLPPPTMLPPGTPDPPIIQDTSVLSATSVLLKWNATSANFSVELSLDSVSWKQTKCNQSLVHEACIVTQTEATITSLKPYTNYTFRVVAQNVLGRSNYSSESKWVVTNEAAPSHGPIITAAYNLSSQEIFISWQSLPPETLNGKLRRYELHITEKNTLPTSLPASKSSDVVTYSASSVTSSLSPMSSTPVPTTPSNGGVTEPPTEENGRRKRQIASPVVIDVGVALSHRVGGLKKWTSYEVEVRAVTVAPGPFSDKVTVRTDEDVPTHPTELTAKAVNSTAIFVNWTKPAEMNGVLVKYQVIYSEEDSSKLTVTRDVGKAESVLLTSLNSFTLYAINVSAFTSKGGGNHSTVLERTDEGQPSLPQNLSTQSVNSTAILVSWQQPGKPNGKIKYRLSLSTGSEQMASFKLVYDGESTQYLVSNLKPYTQYNFKVTAYNVKYNLSSSSVVTMETTAQAAPSGPPQNVRAITNSSSSIILYWMPLKAAEQNGEITRYRIHISSSALEHAGQLNAMANTTTLAITGLQAYTNYSFSMQAVNDAGIGPYSSTVTNKTFEAEPSPARNITAKSVNSTAIKVAWVKALHPNGIIRYQLYMRLHNDDKLKNRLVYEGINTGFVMSGLEEYVTYIFTVVSFNIKYTWTSKPVVVMETTHPAEPSGPPQDVQALTVSSTAIEVKWSPPLPSERNGIIILYTVQYTSQLGETNNTTAIGTSIVVNGLAIFMKYSFTVKAWNLVGAGPESEAVSNSTLEDRPSPPTNIGTQTMNSSAIKVTWQAPLKPNGEIQYRLYYWQSSEGSGTRKLAYDGSLVEYTVAGLHEYVTYMFMLQAYNVKYSWSSTAVNASETTHPAEPSGPPHDVVALTKSSTSILVKWSPPSELDRNGIITHYIVKYNVSLETEANISTSDNSTQTLVAPLKKYAPYYFTVQAVNTIGVGPRSAAVINVTFEDLPGQPVIENVNEKSDSLEVMWKPPVEANGIIKTFRLCWRLVEVQNRTCIVLNGATRSYEIPYLKAFSQYTVSLTASTSVGLGQNYTNIYTTTEGVPSKPQDLRAWNMTGHSIVVTWKKPLNVNGRLQGYTVFYRPTSSTDQPLSKNVGLHTNTTLSQLTPYTFYDVTVQAVTGAGGGATSLVQILTDETVPSKPQDLRALNITGYSIVVMWKKPLNVNGRLQRYTVFYRPTSSTDQPLSKIVGLHTNTTLSQLTPYTFYDVSVQAVTGAGGGATSLVQIMTDETEPSAVVSLIIHTERITSHSMELSWQPPSKPNGKIGYYLYYWKTSGDASAGKSIILAGNTRNKLVGGLKAYTHYTFSVVAYNLKKNLSGPRRLEYGMTKATVPSGPPRNVVINETTSTSLTLSWDPPLEPNGEIVGYDVKYYEPDKPGKKTINDNVNGRIYTIKDLEPWRDYRIHVACQSTGGIGPFSDFVEKRTDPGAPPPLGTLAPPDKETIQSFSFRVELAEASNEKGVVSFYQVIVIELATDNTDKAVPAQDPDSYKAEDLKTYDEARRKKPQLVPYIAAEFSAKDFDDFKFFVVGDGKQTSAVTKDVVSKRKRRESATRSGFYNGPLEEDTFYAVFQRAYVNKDVYTSSPWIEPVETAAAFRASPKTPVTTSIGLIVGLVLVIVIVCILILVGIYFVRRKRTNFDKVLDDREDYSNGQPVRMKKMSRKRRSLQKRLMGSTESLDGLEELAASRARRLPVPIDDFERHVDRMHMDGDHGFSEEYALVQPDDEFSFQQFLNPANKYKNRYANIVAYDHTRVMLNPIEGVAGSDYMNANFIDGYNRQRAYIAAQGPLMETFDDFWRMMWEQMSSVIVMLTKLEERGRRKCDQYWPERGMKNYGPIQVTLKQTLNMSHYTVRKLVMTHKQFPDDDRAVKQFHFTAWPDHGVPSHPTPLLSLVRHTFSANRESVGPMVVHCSAGVGRTGTFITLDVMLQRISQEDSVDVFGFVRQMRYQRNFMVQTEAQYVFIHDALHEAITCGVTEVEAKDLGCRIRELRQFDPETGYTYLENEFCRLAKEENHPIAFKSASLNCNAAKNRYANILPFESTRVHLKMRPGEMGSDYVNASFIDGYCQPRAYIATQAPVPDTFEDIWRLVWEQESATIVMLTREEEAGKVKCHHYWPSEGSRLYGVILVEQTEESSFGDYISRKFKLTHTEAKESRTVTQFQYTDWPDTGLPDSGVGIVDLIGQVQKWQQQSGNTIIVIHCSGGVGRTGVFCGISMMIERLKAEGLIDVFQTVQAMRLQRPAMVQTAEQYEFCYTTLQEYLDSFDLYANFQ